MKNSIFYNRNFSLLYASRFISSVGTKFFTLAIAWWILSSEFENANSLLGIVMAAIGIGTFVLATFMGTFADKYDKKVTMLVALLGSLIIVGIVIAIFPVLKYMPLLFALFAIFISIFESLFATSLQSSLNYIVKSEILSSAVSAVSGITSFSQAIGAAFVGVTITFIGIIGAFSFNCVCYLIGAILVCRIASSLSAKKQNQCSKSTYWIEFAEGFKYILKEKELLKLLLLFAFINFWASPIVLALPIITKEVFQGTALLMSGYEIVLAVGVIVITTVLSYVKCKFNRYKGSFYAIALCGLSLCGLSLCQYIQASFVFIFIFGVGMGLCNVSMMTLFQTYVPPYIQGRFFSIVNTVTGVVIPFSYVFVGFLSISIDIMNIMLINGIILGFSSFALLFIPKINAEYRL
jgi:MFS family permease